ncbi:MAG: ATP-dependent protease ATPase subunit HslU [Candidatus Borkfalkiaceae bacterium]|nr:ATP-dependent protease ATPase subunit HslU [Christensenellaceae bacterium]
MDYTPREIVNELDKYIIGQNEAKHAVAIALRNRYRRSKLPLDLMEEVTPKNIIMKGPTGVGKTEIARRLAKLVKAPFIKVEATKYTEVGYVGRDVESMVRDLVESSIRLVKDEYLQSVNERASAVAEKRLSKVVCAAFNEGKTEGVEEINPNQALDGIKAGIYDEMIIEIEVKDAPKPMEVVPGGAEINIGTIFGDMLPQRKKKKRMTVKEARKIFTDEEAEKLIDDDAVVAEGVRRAEQEGIIFIDEIDKIAGKSDKNSGPDVSREGVQRDILPIVEGCTVQTKYGMVKTDYILFIAAGAFHVAAVSDLIPELQGRFPITVELKSLTKDDFVQILTTPKNAITMQYEKLLEVDNVKLEFEPDGIEEIASLSAAINEQSEDIGARRLHTVMENLLDDVSFNACGNHPLVTVKIDKVYVDEHLDDVVKKQNLKKYVL